VDASPHRSGQKKKEETIPGVGRTKQICGWTGHASKKAAGSGNSSLNLENFERKGEREREEKEERDT